MATSAHVLIVTDEHAARGRIRAALEAAGEFVIHTDGGLVPSEIDVLIVVALDDAEVSGLRAEHSAETALLSVGGPTPGPDAWLPADFADRELVLACRLLGEIGRLRHAARHTASAADALDRAAHSDPLTGALNRRGWDREFAARVAQAQSAGQAVCLALVDVDQFKQVNDQHGHSAGDAVLQAVASGLAAALRTNDLIARLGGDEFGVLLTGRFSRERAAEIVERARQELNRQVQPVVAGVTLSAGCGVLLANESGSPQSLFELGDTALRTAKQSGRNRTALV